MEPLPFDVDGTSPISKCRFSPDGNTIASASVDGAVRVWPTNAEPGLGEAFFCFSLILSLEWTPDSEFLLCGTSDGKIKVWSKQTKKLVHDIAIDPGYPSVYHIRCSPTESLFICAGLVRPHTQPAHQCAETKACWLNIAW